MTHKHRTPTGLIGEGRNLRALAIYSGCPTAGGLAVALAGAPWWADACIVTLCLLLNTFLLLALVFVPQDSHHRLKWWRDKRRYRRRFRGAAPRPKAHSGS